MKDSSENSAGRYDLAVIGAGSAGFSAAITAAEEGARVALIGHGVIGGTCVNVGCVPSKAMIRAVEPLHQAATADRFGGIEAGARVTDWAAIVGRKKALVDALRAAKYTDLLPGYPTITYLEGPAYFDDGGTLRLDRGPVPARKILIATGSRPRRPDIPGLDRVPCHDSTSILELTELPASLIVIGGGYIGVELAQVFARAGTGVTIVTRRGLLPEAEPEIGDALTGYFNDEGIAVRRVTRYMRADLENGEITLTSASGHGTEKVRGAALLLAAGRVPNTGGLGLDNGGIARGDDGGIRVDPQMRTSRAGVYAAGDVTGRDPFVYMAAYGAKIAARNALAGDRLSYDNAAMPAVVFSDPQVAGVGLTEARAIASGHAVRTSVLPLAHLPRALAARDTRGLIKLVADRATKKLLGAHILAPEGADSIQTAAMAIRAGMTYEDLGAAIFPYLTTVEGLKLAAQSFDRDVARLSCCAG